VTTTNCLTKIFTFIRIFPMMEFNKRQKLDISKNLFDITKIILAIVVLGPIVSAERFKLVLFICGLAIFFIIFGLAIFFDKGE